jgi:hypothetical protein
MVERVINAFWVALGAAAAVHAAKLGLVGPSGPESGLFPLLAALIVLGAGLALLLRPSTHAAAPRWPQGAALKRVAGIVIGIALMALALPYLGFALTGAVTMLVLLRLTGDTGWAGAVGLAAASVAAVVWIFGHLLGMPLPRGPWGW